MKLISGKISITVFAAILAVVMLFPAFASAEKAGSTGSAEERDVSIVFTHDMHSHMDKMPKIKTLRDEEQRRTKAVFLLDGGDFSMGTEFHTVFKDEAAELRLMGDVGFDVTTLGNHEFDVRSLGLSTMLNSATVSGNRLPLLVAANIDWDKTMAVKKQKEDGERLKRAMDKYGVEPYKVISRNGVRIGVFGIFGREADDFAPESGTNFKDQVKAAKRTVDAIKKKENVDLIVCLSHSGTKADNPDNSEDEILAQKVEGIDVIISGHTHTELEKPIVVGETIIASCGEYNHNAGVIRLKIGSKGKEMTEYNIVPLNNRIADDKYVAKKVEQFRKKADTEYFADFGYTLDRILAKQDFSFADENGFGHEQGESSYGNLLADSYIHGVKEVEGDKYRTVDVSIVPSGVVRGVFEKGDVTVADAFNALSLGTGKDGKAGYPLVSVYLSGKELKLIPEIDISVSDMMPEARLYMYGLSYKYNTDRLFLNRAYDIRLDRGEGKYEDIEDDKLYRVVADLYSAQMLGMVNSMSYGILSVEPKNEDGSVIGDFENNIIYDKAGAELKEWYALATYVDSFSHDEIPAYYEKTDNRKVQIDSRNIIDLLKSPNKFFWYMVIVIAVLLTVMILIIVLLIRLIGRRRSRRRRKKSC